MLLTVLRSTVYTLLQIVITPLYFLIVLAAFPLPPLSRYRITSGWAHLMLYLLRMICGIDYRIIGAERIPRTPSIILSKHQSAWETLAFQQIFPPQVHVLKRELLWIPFFGWGLALMSPIAIDRTRGFAALRNIARRGRERLEQGFWIVVFPEGTRVAPGEKRHYQLGGAWLAAASGAPIVPVAHNAGRVWPRNAFLKHPGTVTVRIGPPIDASSCDAKKVN